MTNREERVPACCLLAAHSYYVMLSNLSLAQHLMVAHGLGRGRLGCAGQSHPKRTHALHTPCMCMPEPRGHERKGKVGSEGATKKWPKANNQ